MVPKKQQQSVRVLITTYKRDLDRVNNRMDIEQRYVKTNRNKFICSICLNAKDKNYNQGLCGTCQKNSNAYNVDVKDTNKREETKPVTNAIKANPNKKDHITKSLVKQETEFSEGLNLLNEVLTVFKSKKQSLQNKKSSKSLLFKDVSTSTDNDTNINARTELVLSEVFLCSIEGNKDNENCKFTVVNSRQPDYFKKEYIINLKKHKSSSIPQMRMDELKNSLKEKTKSKDITEEVNRIFATVNMDSITKKTDHSNRPVIRKGPRVLPVVKTKMNEEISLKQSCKCCQTSEYCLSSGDSFVKPNINHKRCEKPDYMSCCHYEKNHRRTQTDVVVCQNCHNITEKRCDCDKSFQTNCYKNVG